MHSESIRWQIIAFDVLEAFMGFLATVTLTLLAVTLFFWAMFKLADRFNLL